MSVPVSIPPLASPSLIIEKHHQEELTSFSPKSLDNWAPDNETLHCYACKTSFGVFIRRHHCRLCGRIFCYSCSGQYRKIPRLFQRILPSGSKLLDMKVPHRVCVECSKKIDTIDECTDNMVIELERHMDLEEIRRYHSERCLERVVNRKAASICLSYFRKVLHYFPDHIYTDLDVILFNTNYLKFAGHNRWTVQYIKAVEQRADKDYKDNVASLVENCSGYCTRRESCLNLCCGPHCGPLSLEDSLELLPSSFETVHNVIVQNLNKLPSNELRQWLPLIVPHLNFPILRNFILTKINQFEIGFLIYTILSVTHLPCEPEMEWLIPDISKREKVWSNSLNWFKRIEDDLPGEFWLPIGDKFLMGWTVKREDIKILASSSSPTVIPFVNVGLVKHILYKKQDVRKDWLAMVCIHWINRLLKEHNLNITMKTYEVLPLTTSSGLIEIAPGETIYNLSKKWSIQNYILEHNPSLTVEHIRKVYIESTAAYTVFSYIMGLGDRHSDNVMIDQKGNLFHIDYDYILGEDPKPSVAPTIRISGPMIDAMGGIESTGFKDFLNIAVEIYLILRQHVNSLYIILLGLEKVGIKREKIASHIRERLLVGMRDDEARNTFRTTLSNSYSSDKGEMLDRIHYHTKESSVISSISSVSRSFTSYWFGK